LVGRAGKKWPAVAQKMPASEPQRFVKHSTMKRGKNEFYNLESNRAWSVSAGKTFPSYKLLTGFADLAPKKVDTRPGKKVFSSAEV
jgi:hypothetical protein